MTYKLALPLPLEQDKLYTLIKEYNTRPEHTDITGFIKTIIGIAQNESKTLYEELNRYLHRGQNAYTTIKAHALLEYINDLTHTPVNHTEVDGYDDSPYPVLACENPETPPECTYRKHISRYYISGVSPGVRRSTVSNYDKHITNAVLIGKILNDGDLEAVVIFCAVLASLGE